MNKNPEAVTKQRKALEDDNPVVRAFMYCRDALIRSLVKMSVKPEDVEDILQETFVKTYSANEKKKIRSPQDYLFVVSRNLVMRGVTHRSRELNIVIDDALFDISESSAETELNEKLKLQALNDALASLPDNQRQAILLRKVYGFSSRDIARKMGVSKSSVDKYIAAGIKKCEEILDAEGYQIDGGEVNDKVLDQRKE